jgi:hypothetical protein
VTPNGQSRHARLLKDCWADAARLAATLRRIEVEVDDEHKELLHDAACAVESATTPIDRAIRGIEL